MRRLRAAGVTTESGTVVPTVGFRADTVVGCPAIVTHAVRIRHKRIDVEELGGAFHVALIDVLITELETRIIEHIKSQLPDDILIRKAGGNQQAIARRVIRACLASHR